VILTEAEELPYRGELPGSCYAGSTLIGQGKLDTVVEPRNAARLRDGLGSTRKALVILPRSDHRADRDPKEELRAGRPRGVLAEHGSIGLRAGRPCIAPHSAIAIAAPSKTLNQQAFEASRQLIDLQYTPIQEGSQQC